MAHGDARIGEEVADVLLYLLQVADHCQIDVEQAVKDKLVKNAVKHPAKRVIARVSPTGSALPRTHVLLDYENTQPSDAQLRALVADVSDVWVFHGPHQRDVEKRFTSFGGSATAVPISRTGKNALDFHLSFYMGYIASRNPDSAMVVVANDKGYEPMLSMNMGGGAAPAKKAAVEGRSQEGAVKPATAKQPAAKKVAAGVAGKNAVPAKQSAIAKLAAKSKTPVPAAIGRGGVA
jgi:hypothetical protein